jgi:hypothetical protein
MNFSAMEQVVARKSMVNLGIIKDNEEIIKYKEIIDES